MSIFEQIYFDPGHSDIRSSACRLAATLQGRFIDNDSGVGVSVDVDELQADAFVTGGVSQNPPIETVDPDDPTDREIFDGYPLVWAMASSPGDLEFARVAARRMFDLLAGSDLGWPLVLAHNDGELIATYDLQRGVREFAPGTRPDGVDEHLWR